MKFWLFYVAFLALSFDFKADNEIKIYAQIIAITFFASAALSLAIFKFRIKSNKRVARTLALMMLFLAASIIVVSINNTPIDRFVSVASPFYICILGYFMVLGYARHGFRVGDFIGVMYFGGVVSLLWTLFFGVVVSGVSLNDARYQIVSQAAPFLMAIIFFKFVHLRVTKLKDYIVFLILFLIIALSLTRSLLMPFMAFIFVYVLFYSRLPRGRFSQDIKLVGVGLPFFIVLALIAMLFRSDIYDAWVGRLVGGGAEGGVDLTYLTRVSEYKAQISIVTESISSFLLGKGFGATYNWDFAYFSAVSDALTYDEFTRDYWFAGHSLWVYSFFSGGITWGLIFPIIILRALFFSIKNIGRGLYSSEQWIFVYGLIAFVSVSLTSNPLAFRYSAFILGVTLACIDLYITRQVKDDLNI